MKPAAVVSCGQDDIRHATSKTETTGLQHGFLGCPNLKQRAVLLPEVCILFRDEHPPAQQIRINAKQPVLRFHIDANRHNSPDPNRELSGVGQAVVQG